MPLLDDYYYDPFKKELRGERSRVEFFGKTSIYYFVEPLGKKPVIVKEWHLPRYVVDDRGTRWGLVHPDRGLRALYYGFMFGLLDPGLHKVFRDHYLIGKRKEDRFTWKLLITTLFDVVKALGSSLRGTLRGLTRR
jgi:hypothetical protein